MTTAVLVWNPNPTLDVVSVVRTLSPGTVHRAHRQLLTPGGKGTLVVRGLRLLDVECEGVTPLAGQSGALARALLEAEQLPFRVSDVSGMTRIAVTVADEENGGDTVINGPGPDTADAPWRQHVSLVREMIASSRFRYFVIAGRPPLSTELRQLRTLLEAAEKAGVKTVVDMSSPFLEECLRSRPWLVKVNRLEAQEVAGTAAAGPDLAHRIRALGARNAVITDGPARIYAELLDQSWAVDPPVIDLASAVGCGDAFLAGLMAGLAHDATSGGTALRSAVSAASASAEDLRPGFFSPARMRALQPMVKASPGQRQEPPTG